jgi:DNA-binding transcriptional ArsR family regulator
MVAKHGTARDDRRPNVSNLRTMRGKSDGAPASASSAEALDRLIHERLRLGIVSALAVNDTLSFHARKLEEAEYIACTKSFEGRMPKTQYRLTPAGRRALERYLDHMEALIRATRER